MVWSSLAVLMVNQYGPATGGGPSIDIAPSIADHKASPQVNSSSEGSILQKPRLGLAAAATLGVVMKANAELVDWQRRAQRGVHRLHSRPVPRTPSHIGLISHHYKLEAHGLQLP
jgi:hypothetical protein